MSFYLLRKMSTFPPTLQTAAEWNVSIYTGVIDSNLLEVKNVFSLYIWKDGEQAN